MEYIANISNGDLRKAIGILEIIINSNLIEELHIDTDIVKEVSQKNISMNKSDYYDWISMLQKSLRGSQVDAALISLAVLLKAGYLEETIRRIFIIASEDCFGIGKVYSTFYSLTQASKQVGNHEYSMILSHAVILLRTATKSNSAYTAIKVAMDDVKNIC